MLDYLPRPLSLNVCAALQTNQCFSYITKTQQLTFATYIIIYASQNLIFSATALSFVSSLL